MLCLWGGLGLSLRVRYAGRFLLPLPLAALLGLGGLLLLPFALVLALGASLGHGDDDRQIRQLYTQKGPLPEPPHQYSAGCLCCLVA